MKRVNLVRVGMVLLFFALSAGYAAAAVQFGPHDLSVTGPGGFATTEDQVCIFCHTPHNSNVNETYTTDPNIIGSAGSMNGVFLWNRALPNRSFQLYSSATMDHTVGQPGTLSLMCLSCHDGVGAMNVLLNYSASGQPGGLFADQFGDFSLNDPSVGPLNIGEAVCTGSACTGGDELRNDHPIGFVYGGSATDAGLNDIASMSAAMQRRFSVTGNRMECSTCHNPHLDNFTGNNFLVIDNAGSALCFECHNK